MYRKKGWAGPGGGGNGVEIKEERNSPLPPPNTTNYYCRYLLITIPVQRE